MYSICICENKWGRRTAGRKGGLEEKMIEEHSSDVSNETIGTFGRLVRHGMHIKIIPLFKLLD